MEELFIPRQPKQSQHCRVHPGTDLFAARQDRLAFVLLPFYKCVAVKKKKKAAKRAILSAVMNNEASVITGDSEGARGVCSHIHQQPSGGLSRFCEEPESETDTQTHLDDDFLHGRPIKTRYPLYITGTQLL